MDAILARLPDAASLSNAAARLGAWAGAAPGRLEGYVRRTWLRWAAFLAGALGTLMVGLLFSVIYTGHGAFADPPPASVVVYPNF